MSIKTKIIILAIFSLVVTTTVGLILFQNSLSVIKEIEKQTIIGEIRVTLLERAVLRNDYLLHHEERPVIQSQRLSEALEKLFLQLSPTITLADEQISLKNLRDNSNSVNQIFSQIVAQPSPEASAGAANIKELEQRLTSQILIKSQDNIVISAQLVDASRDRVIESQNRTTTFVLVFLTSAIVIILLVLFFIWFSIAKPLIKLKEAAVRIASLDFSSTTTTTTGKNSNDEIGQLARAFDQMIVKLKESYMTLEKKVQDRTQDLEKYKLAMDNTYDSIMITDPEGIMIYGNKAMERTTGYKSEEALGKKIGVLWKSPMPPAYYQKLWDTIKKQKKVFTSEIQNRKKNGEVYTAVISISPILDKNGEIEFFVGVEHDISKEKAIDKAKTEFVSLASHQLRTPLSTVSWYAEMLLAGDAGKLNAEQKKYLDEVYRSNQRMVGLVNALLNVSRLELGTFVVESEPMDILALARSMIDEQKPYIEEKKLKLTEKYVNNLPLLNADPKLLSMVFQNLLSNAVRYTPEGGKIEISLSLDDKKNVLLKISDTGYGIPKNQQDKIFTKLFRADNVREKDAEGTGLGLYIVKSILEHSGGKIWFESQEDKGTIFYVTLPLEGMKKKDGTKQLS